MTRKFWLAGALFLLSPLAFGVQLVKDVNAVPLDSYSGGSDFAQAVQTTSGIVFFSQDLDHGIEPWVTDGTAAGTRLLKDINPGPASSAIEMVTAMNGLILFLANDGANGLEVWRSDGTVDGTRMVANIGPGAANGVGSVIVLGRPLPIINNVMYFGGNDGTTGDELWRTDGTAAGTYRLSDGVSGNGGIQPMDFRVVGSRLYFLGTDSAGEELWTSDGTVAGTRRVADINPTTDRHIGFMRVVGNVLFFAANDGAHGSELWRANASGTAAMVADLNTLTSDASSAPVAIGVGNDRLIFSAATSSGGLSLRLLSITATGNPTVLLNALPGEEIVRITDAPGGVMITFWDRLNREYPIFMTDGTLANTGFVNSELRFWMGSLATATVGQWLYFYGQEGFGAPGNIYRTAGTVASTTLYATVNSPAGGDYLEALNGKLFFINGRFNDALHGNELWSTDGTSTGTQMVADLNPGTGDSLIHLKVIGSRLFFSLFEGDTAFAPWVTDGTAANMTRLVDAGANTVTGDSEPNLLGNVGAYTLFYADDGIHDNELWSTNGTTAGTSLLYDRPNGSGIDTSAGFLLQNGFALFAGISSAGTELWRTDGTPAGTVLVKDIAAGPVSSEMRLYDGIVMNGVAYFIATDGVHGIELWRSDGTSAGTRMVFDAVPGAADGASSVLDSTANGRVFVRGDGGPPPVYSTDGTEAGTVIVNNSVNLDVWGVFAYQNRVCFNVIVVNAGSDYYCSTGAAGNFTRFSDFESMGMVPTSKPYVINGKVIVSAVRPGGLGGGGIYLLDGVAAPQKISDQHFGTGMFLDGGARFAFEADIPGGAMVVTDGTSAGTHTLLTGASVPGRQIVYSTMTPVNDSLVFRVVDPDLGAVVWKTDGTPAGTRFLFDVDPEGLSPDRPPAGFLQNGSTVFFTAERASIGHEIWSFDTAAPNATDDFAETTFGTSVNIPIAANDADFDSGLPAPNVEVVTAPAHGTVTVSAGAINYSPNANFAGVDTLTYRVSDAQGNPSNTAYVTVTTHAQAITNPPGTAPGTAPTPPSNPPPSSGGGTSGGGGGGGAFGLELLLGLLLLPRRSKRASHG